VATTLYDLIPRDENVSNDLLLGRLLKCDGLEVERRRDERFPRTGRLTRPNGRPTVTVTSADRPVPLAHEYSEHKED